MDFVWLPQLWLHFTRIRSHMIHWAQRVTDFRLPICHMWLRPILHEATKPVRRISWGGVQQIWLLFCFGSRNSPLLSIIGNSSVISGEEPKKSWRQTHLGHFVEGGHPPACPWHLHNTQPFFFLSSKNQMQLRSVFCETTFQEDLLFFCFIG